MSGESLRVDHVFLVLFVTAVVVSCALFVGSIAFRQKHYLIELAKRLRCTLDGSDSQEHDGAVRANFLMLAAFLLWFALIVCALGIRYVVG